MNNYSYYISPPYELYHHSIKGQKWGVRRYQNDDGSLTSAGKQRYSGESRKTYKARRDYEKWDKASKSYSEDELRNGIKTKKGKTLYSADEVRKMQAEDRSIADQKKARYDKLRNHDEAKQTIAKNLNEYRQDQDFGKKALKTLVMGPFGRRTYDMARAMNHSRAESLVMAYLDLGIQLGPISGKGVSLQRQYLIEEQEARQLGRDQTEHHNRKI